jgi:hypothetical protein
MVSKVYENLIYSMNPTEQKNAFSTQVQSDFEGTCNKVKSAISTMVQVGTQVYGLVSDTIQAAQNSEPSNVSLKEINVVPTCVENIFGQQYAEAICTTEEADKDSEMSKIVQEVGKKIIEQSDRKDLDFKITVKKDNQDINAYVIPGGKIVITSGLLNRLYENSNNVDEFKDKISGTLGYLVARASLSQQVKQVQTSGLIGIISKVIKFVFGMFFPVNDTSLKAKVKLSPEAKKQQAISKIVDLSVDLGEKIILDHQKKSAEKEARELALKYAVKAGFEIEEEDLEDTLQIAFEEDDSEEYDEQIQENLVKIFPQVTKLFV